MAALDRERKTPQLSDHTVIDLIPQPMKAATRAWAGAIGVLDAGFIVPARSAPGLIAVGRFESNFDNTAGKDGDLIALLRQGTFPLFNSGGADAITQLDVGKECFLVDDQTVAKTDGAGTRSRAGKVMRILRDDASFIWVQIGLGL